jgi:hypothetical protein
VPVIAPGGEYNIIDVVTVQPEGDVYVIVAKPDVAGGVTVPPVTIPVVRPTGTWVLSLVHVPPVIASDSSIVDPVHTLPRPAIGGGPGSTVTEIDTLQVVVYVMVSTPGPLPEPYTVPENASTVARTSLLLCQKPPGMSSDNVVVPPAAHTIGMPVIGSGSAVTVTVAVVSHPVPRV